VSRPWDGELTPLQLALASNEGVDSSYVSRMVKLTNLAPDTVAAILTRLSRQT